MKFKAIHTTDSGHAMLSDEKKSLIEAEERYRHAIASKLRAEMNLAQAEVKEVKREIWGGVQEFLNSNVGMWLLSSVLITGGASLYQTIQHRYDEKLHDKAQLITLQFELANRIQNMKYFWRKANTVDEGEFALKSIFQSKTPINPDVEKINLSVLYFNFYQLRGKQNKEVLGIVRELEDMEYELQTQKPNAPLSDINKTKGVKLIGQLEQTLVEEGFDIK
jgi:hypothetical protein